MVVGGELGSDRGRDRGRIRGRRGREEMFAGVYEIQRDGDESKM